MRWTAQLLVGGLPGILICGVIMWIASKPASDNSGTHIASIVPLLSANGLVDSPAFHRLNGGAVPHAPQFRVPVEAPIPEPSEKSEASRLDIESPAPRIAWNHLSSKVRAQIDEGLAKHREWDRVILHGSGLNHGNAKLMDRYHASVRGLAQGLSYHFVIGNGSGANDGLIETGSHWSQPVSETQDTSISVCLIGDFNNQAPTKAQLEAVREFMDYLSIKLGKLELTTHHSQDGTASACLGTKFVDVEGLR